MSPDRSESDPRRQRLAIVDSIGNDAGVVTIPAIDFDDQLSPVRLVVELLALYVAGPVLIALAIWTWRLPLAPFLLLFMIGFGIMLLRDRSFSVTQMLRATIPGATLRGILLLLPLGVSLVLALAWLIEPERFLTFPRERFGLWLVVMVAYPLVPVIAQEIIYRVFFWHRYGALFAGRPLVAVVVNAVLFGFAHVIMRNWISVILSFLAGLVLAWRYQRGRSFWAAVLEHGIYGDLIFTAGLGLYFYSGAIRL